MNRRNLWRLYEETGNKENHIILSIISSLYFVSFLTMITALIGTTLDGLIISRFLGETSFGAYGLASPLYNLIEMMGGVVATGTIVVVSNLIGSGKEKEANNSFSAGFTFGVLMGVVVGVLLIVYPQASRFLVIKGNADQFMDLMFKYVRGIAPGIPFMVLNTLLIPVVQLDGGKKRVSLSATVLCVMNILGDILVVTLTDFGLFGVGVVTSVSYLFSSLVLLAHFSKGRSVFRPHYSMRGLKASLAHGIPSVFSRAATFLRNYVYNILALQFGGPVGVVAWSAVNSLTAFLSGFPKASGQETLVGSGVFYGERDKDSLKRFMKYSILFGLLVSVVVIVLLCLAAPILIGIYISSSSKSFHMAVVGLRWYALGMFPFTLNLIFANYFQSAKKKMLTNIINFMDGFGALIVFALFLLNVIGFDGLCLSFFFGKWAVFIGTMIYIKVKRKKTKLKVSDLLLLPDDFDVPKEDRYVLTVDKDYVKEVAQRSIVDFCRERGIEKKRSTFTGLAVEEMIGVIAEEGFVDGKDHNIDVKLFIKDGHINIRLRDDCKTFDTAKRLELLNPEEPTSHIGIRILNQIAQDTEYFTTMNINYTVMHVAPPEKSAV